MIAVDVTTRYQPPTADGYRRRARLRRERELGQPDSAAELLETISRSLVLGSVDTEQAAREHADVVIQPVEPDVGMLEWHQLDRVRERGRRAAREVLGSTDRRCSGCECGLMGDPGRVTRSISTVYLGVDMDLVRRAALNTHNHAVI